MVKAGIRWVFMVLLATGLVWLCACGGREGTGAGLDGAGQPAVVNVTIVKESAGPAVIEVSTAAVPDSVEPELFEALRSALLAALAERDTGRETSTAPQGEANAVTDLRITGDSTDGYFAEWTYRNCGDYNYDGLVGVSDLTPVGIYYECSSGDANWDAARAADGNGDGMITIADITPIGLHYGATLTGYAVQYSAHADAEEQEWADVYQQILDLYELAPEEYNPNAEWTGKVAAGDVPLIRHSLAGTYGPYIRVVPFHQAGEERLLGGPSPVACNQAMLGDDDWTTAGHDAQHTGQSPFTGPQTPTLKWAFCTTGAGFDFSQAAVDAGGNVYVIAGEDLHKLDSAGNLLWRSEPGLGLWGHPACGPNGDCYVPSYGNFRAFTSDGEPAWTYSTSPFSIDTVTVGAGGVIYALDDGIRLHAVSPDGTPQWMLELGLPDPGPFPSIEVVGPPVVGSDGTIFVPGPTDDYYYTALNAVSPDGSLSWQYEYSAVTDFIPAVAPEGDIYICTADRLIALDSAGDELWKYTSGDEIMSQPVLDGSGVIYFNCADNYLYAVNPDGGLKWTYLANAAFKCAPEVGSDGRIFVSDAINRVHSVSPDGTAAWVLSVAGTVRATPAAGPLGNVYFASSIDNNLFYAVDPAGSVLWTYTPGNKVTAAPVLGADGTVYFGGRDGQFYAVNPDGTARWVRDLDDAVSTPAAVGQDGTIYVADAASRFHAFDQTGEERWSVLLDTCPRTGPLIATDGTIYCQSYFKLYSIDPLGTVRWTYDEVISLDGGPTLHPDGSILLNKYLGGVTAVDPAGEKLWDYSLGLWDSMSTTSVAADGMIYGTGKDALFAVNPDGSLKWSCELGGRATTTPALDTTGIVYLGCTGNLYAINPDGSIKWVTATRGAPWTHPAIGADGIIYVGSSQDLMLALDADGNELWSYQTGGQVNSAPALSADGTLYFGCDDGRLYAIQDY